MIHELSEADFRPLIGEIFTLILGGGELALELVESGRYSERPGEVRVLGGLEVHIRPDPFWVVFRGPAEPALGQGSFTLTHPALGDLGSVFLVAVGGDDGGRLYQVVVN